jgi:hypothetical protein
MATEVLACLGLLQLKHYIVDFPLQSEAHLATKGKYGNLTGVSHSLLHGIGTMVCLAPFLVNSLVLMLMLGALDFLIHYHVDWIKTNFGNKDISKKAFWNQLGQDQLAHQLTYLLIVFLTF